MAAGFATMKQSASFCTAGAAGTSCAAFCVLLDTALLAVSIFIIHISLLGRLIIP